jgi:hypothetical protein
MPWWGLVKSFHILSLAFVIGCAPYPALDADARKAIIKRDKLIKRNLSSWRSQLYSDSRGGLVILTTIEGTHIPSVAFQGATYIESKQVILDAPTDSLCVWFWRETLALPPEIKACEIIRDEIVFKELNSEALRSIRIEIQALNQEIIRLSNSQSVDRRKLNTHKKNIESIEKFVNSLEKYQLNTRKIAVDSTEFTKLVMSFLQEIQTVAREQNRSLKALAATKE